MTKSEKTRLATKAELIMMGYGQRVNTQEETVFILDHIAKTLGFADSGKEIVKNALQYSDARTYVCAVIASRIGGDVMLTLALHAEPENPDEFDPWRPDDEYGNLCYVYDASAPWCSELGYSGLQILNGKLCRRW